MTKNNGNNSTPKKKRPRNAHGQDWKPKFLAELAESPNVSKAAHVAGLNRTTAYKARQTDPEFAGAWDDAIEQSVDKVEDALFRCAGEMKTKGSVTAAIFLLKAHRPKRYQETHRYQHEGVPGGEPIRITREEILAEPDFLAFQRAKALRADSNGKPGK